MKAETDADLISAWRRARGCRPADARVTLLDIGESECTVVWGGAAQPAVRRLPIGVGPAGRLSLRHDPPTPLELENAIAVVEDEVMPLARLLPRPSDLVGRGGAMQAIARAAGLPGPGEVIVPTDAVEFVFEQLAAVSEGRPAASSGLPPGSEFAATLLTVREFMHHTGFMSIAIDMTPPDAAA